MNKIVLDVGDVLSAYLEAAQGSRSISQAVGKAVKVFRQPQPSFALHLANGRWGRHEAYSCLVHLGCQMLYLRRKASLHVMCWMKLSPNGATAIGMKFCASL